MNLARSFLVPVGGVDPSSQRTYLSDALTASDNMYEDSENKVDEMITMKATTKSRASAAGASRTLPSSVDDKITSETEFNENFKANINNKENFNHKHHECKECQRRYENSHLVPHLIGIAKRAAIVGGEEPNKDYTSITIDDSLGSGKLNNSVIKDYMLDDRSSSPKTAVDDILKDYLKDNIPPDALTSSKVNENNINNETTNPTTNEPIMKEIPGNKKVFVKKLEPKKSGLSVNIIASVIVVLIFIILIIFFTDLITLSYQNNDYNNFNSMNTN